MINKIIFTTVLVSVIIACAMTIVILLFKWLVLDKKNTETWHTSKGNKEMPKGLFDRIYDDETERGRE